MGYVPTVVSRLKMALYALIRDKFEFLNIVLFHGGKYLDTFRFHRSARPFAHIDMV